jgi:hypothetical protein
MGGSLRVLEATLIPLKGAKSDSSTFVASPKAKPGSRRYLSTGVVRNAKERKVSDMNIKNKLGRAGGIAAATAAIGGLGLTGVASASTAQPAAVTSVSHHAGPATAAAAGCSDGSRAEAAQYAKANQFSEVLTETWTQGKIMTNPTNREPFVLEIPVKVVLRYNSGTSCGWALLDISNVRTSADRFISLDPWIDPPKTWIDRTSDGGATWTKLGERSVGSGNVSTYTGVYNRGPGQMLRACAETDAVPHCTGWY